MNTTFRTWLTCGTVILTSVGCGSVLNDLENAAGREVGKALTSNSNHSNTSSSTGTTGSGSSASVPSTPAPSTGSSGGSSIDMGSSGATSSGSCAMHNADGTMLLCTEFANIPAEAGEIFQHNACVGGNSKWTEAKCPTEGRKGGCKSKADNKGAYTVVWQYMTNMARAGRDGCVKNADNTWME